MKTKISTLICILFLFMSGVFINKKDAPTALDKKLDSLLYANSFDGRIEDQLTTRLGRKLNYKKMDLGRLIFFDPGVGLHQDNACAGCHSPTAGFGDSQPIAIGVQNNDTVGPDRAGVRNQRRTPTVVNNAFYPKLMWNNRFASLSGDPFDNSMGFEFPQPEGSVLFSLDSDYVSKLHHLLVAQAYMPFIQFLEMAGYNAENPADLLIHSNCGVIDLNIFHDELGYNIPPADSITHSPNFRIRDTVLMLINSNPTYRSLFGAIYPEVNNGAPIDFIMVGEAVAEFEFGLVAANAPIDKFARGNYSAMTDAEKRGAVVFFTDGKCVTCHSVAGNSNQMFSDFEVHNAGVPQIHPVFGVGTGNVPFMDITCGGRSVTGTLDLGREEFTGNIADRYLFRSSPLRNLKAQPSFFHNGSFSNLKDALEYHLNPAVNIGTYEPSQFGVPSDLQYNSADMADVMLTLDPELAQGIYLTEDQKSDLLAFLTDGLYDKKVGDKQAKKLVPKEVPSGVKLPYFEFGKASSGKSMNSNLASETATEVMLHPNPVVNSIYIETIGGAGIINVEVIDAVGTIMIHQQVSPGQRTLSISMEQFKPGIYFIRLTNEKNEVITRKVVKM